MRVDVNVFKSYCSVLSKFLFSFRLEFLIKYIIPYGNNLLLFERQESGTSVFILRKVCLGSKENTNLQITSITSGVVVLESDRNRLNSTTQTWNYREIRTDLWVAVPGENTAGADG